MRKGIKDVLRLPEGGTGGWYAIVHGCGYFCWGNLNGISKRKWDYQKVLGKWEVEKDREVAPTSRTRVGIGATGK